jgi:hypothetical protein
MAKVQDVCYLVDGCSLEDNSVKRILKSYKNVEVITAVLMNKADLDNMDVWGRPSNFDQTKLGTSGYLYTYSGIFYLGADIDYEGGTYSSDCYVGTNGYASGTGAYWKNLTFDGQGYSIKNIHISNAYASIFGMWLTDSTVKNLAVTIDNTVTIKLPKKLGLPLIPVTIFVSIEYLSTNLNGVYN